MTRTVTLALVLCLSGCSQPAASPPDAPLPTTTKATAPVRPACMPEPAYPGAKLESPAEREKLCPALAADLDRLEELADHLEAQSLPGNAWDENPYSRSIRARAKSDYTDTRGKILALKQEARRLCCPR